MSLGSTAKWLIDKLVNLVLRGYRRNKEDIKLQTVHMQAALSATRLATAIVRC
jgi:hypothetical protein